MSFTDHRCVPCAKADKPACQCFTKSPRFGGRERYKVNLQKTDHFLCLKCGDQTYGPYWDGAEYWDGFYCERDGTWRFEPTTNQWNLGM